ncbi:hypothetical protein SAMN04487830_11925 [Pseudobutyrivibrio sp. OR37]|uniref:hypothetical protein n=1 Tax=Pseudobutyrivibrio sp. OR37 TaxID=1798186 RepID=UPI0008EC1D48|nr:hypothetical protein [Pseudobutyrivibrio sp. OR37]SFI04425.1 hypothetical protein SAMN04487830_11925 [Pseudobutyrivibrio sp. OR37]
MITIEDNKNNIFKIIIAAIIVMLSYATISYGFYVDENGLLSIYKGIYQGQHMFVDSWETLQTGGLLTYPLLALYYQVLQPLFASLSLNIGLVLYMRICYMTVRLIISVYLYIVLVDSDYEKGAFPAVIFYYMFVIGWKDFSYKSYCDFAMVLIMCYMFRFYKTRKIVYGLLTAIAASVAVVAYPSMIIMAVFIGVLWLYLVIKDEAPTLTVVLYVITCFVLGGLVLVYLQFTSGLGNVIAQLPNLGNQDYDYPVYICFGIMLLSYGVFAVIAYIPIVFVWILNKLRGIDEYAEKAILTLYFIIFMISACLLRIEGISTSRFIYGCLIIFFWFPYFMRDKEKSEFVKIGSFATRQDEDKMAMWTVFVISVVAQIVWSVFNNQQVTEPGYMTLYVVIMMILLFCEERHEYFGLKNFLVLVAMFFMGIWVADSNGGFCHVFERMIYVTEGELKGVALPQDEYEVNDVVINLLEENVTADNKLLVAFGANCAGYLNSNAWQATYSVYARTQLNTKLIDYYKINPDNMADYVLLDTGHDKYQYFVDNETGKYLLETYTHEVAREGDFVLLSKE